MEYIMEPAAAAETGVSFVSLAIVVILVLANAFFVASEFALVSVRKTRIDQLAAEGNGAAAVVQRAVRDLDRYIAATQVGITIASLLLGGFGERALEPLLTPLFTWMPNVWLGMTRAGLAAGFAYFIMTALHVIIGELMPKSIALQKPDGTALWIGRPMLFFAVIFSPLTWLLNGIGNFLLRLIGFHAAEGHSQVHSPEELDMLFTESHKGGEINQTEFEILHRVVRFSDTTARAVMVPRLEMQALPLSITRSAVTDFLQDRPHTRIPVYQDSLDNIVGIINSKDLEHLNYRELSQELEQWKAAISGVNNGQHALNGGQPADEKILDLTPLVFEAAYVPETIRIDKLLTEFKKTRQQMAIVVDEYGGTAGLVTLADLLEQVFGDLPDEGEESEPDIFKRPDGRLQLAGRVTIDEVNELFGFGFRSDEAETMAGLVVNALGRIASVGDEVDINGVHMRVEKVDRLRIETLVLSFPEGREPEEMKQSLP
ncbi:MAG TPA: hemolysin family protein [Anaerolineales bacterium]|jgi:CBS domain containing-hemolysin-like protein|nr:hemolysin family protein [Anaerolineales bacterium]